MKKIQIQGKVVYQNLEGGFWGIVSDDGQGYLPLNMPEQLKTEGKVVSITAKLATDTMSMIMWGKPIKITAFHTLTP